MSHLAGWKSALFVAFVGGFLACSSSKRDFAEDSPALTADAGASDAAAPACEGRRCSRDLHSVVDGCSGETVETCSEDLGCAAGKCVPACDSAAAAQGSIGCSFWAVPPDVTTRWQTSCYAAYVANTWSKPVTVTAEYGTKALDIGKSIYRATTDANGDTSYAPLNGTVPPGEVGVVFLAQGDPVSGEDYTACPAGVNVAFYGNVIQNHGTSIYDAFHISTDLPVSAYAIFPYGGAKSYISTATLLIPTPSWGTNYFVIDGWEKDAFYPFAQIIAQEDNTEVRMRPAIDIKDGYGVDGSPRGFVAKWKLNRGQVLELAQDDTLAGTPIQTDKPVAFFGGIQCTNVPTNEAACDSLQQQIPPVQQWASKYSAVPYESRRTAKIPVQPEVVIWKAVGARAGTTLTYEPERPANAPTTLGAGESVIFTSDFPFVVKSQSNDYPFYLAVYMSGASTYGTKGDPDFVNVIPDEQFLDHYVFFVDHSYTDSNLTVVRRKDQTGFHDVTLDCLGTVTGWKTLGNDDSTEYAWIDITKKRTAVGKCWYGRHEASSDGPFGVYVWGVDNYASYGFPAGAGSRPTSPYTVEIR